MRDFYDFILLTSFFFKHGFSFVDLASIILITKKMDVEEKKTFVLRYRPKKHSLKVTFIFLKFDQTLVSRCATDQFRAAQTLSFTQ